MNEIADLPGIDPSKAHVARMYDYYLGGQNNFEADRMACTELDTLMPGVRGMFINNRRFLARLVRTLARDYGIRQFLDIGSGLPTQENVHQIAKQVHADTRVVSVDNDPIVAVHGRALIADDASTAVILEDARHTGAILDHPDTQRLIDFTKPAALLFLTFLHHIPDHDAEKLVRGLLAPLAPGSFLGISHAVSADPDLRAQTRDLMTRVTEGHSAGRARTRADVANYFTGLDIIPPGLVDVTTWRPDQVPPVEQTRDMIEYGGAGRKPSTE